MKKKIRFETKALKFDLFQKCQTEIFIFEYFQKNSSRNELHTPFSPYFDTQDFICEEKDQMATTQEKGKRAIEQKVYKQILLQNPDLTPNIIIYQSRIFDNKTYSDINRNNYKSRSII